MAKATQERRESHFEMRTRESAGSVSVTMTEKGFTSVFEYVKPAIESKTVFTLWLNMASGQEMLTIVDARGNKAFYNLLPAFNFAG